MRKRNAVPTNTSLCISAAVLSAAFSVPVIGSWVGEIIMNLAFN